MIMVPAWARPADVGRRHPGPPGLPQRDRATRIRRGGAGPEAAASAAAGSNSDSPPAAATVRAGPGPGAQAGPRLARGCGRARGPRLALGLPWPAPGTGLPEPSRTRTPPVSALFRLEVWPHFSRRRESERSVSGFKFTVTVGLTPASHPRAPSRVAGTRDVAAWQA